MSVLLRWVEEQLVGLSLAFQAVLIGLLPGNFEICTNCMLV